MKKVNTLWTIVALLGLMLAICTADGSNGEIGLRACGMACFGIGAGMAGWMRREDNKG
jgi:hypothetical protein